MTNAAAANVSIRFGLKGPNSVVFHRLPQPDQMRLVTLHEQSRLGLLT